MARTPELVRLLLDEAWDRAQTGDLVLFGDECAGLVIKSRVANASSDDGGIHLVSVARVVAGNGVLSTRIESLADVYVRSPEDMNIYLLTLSIKSRRRANMAQLVEFIWSREPYRYQPQETPIAGLNDFERFMRRLFRQPITEQRFPSFADYGVALACGAYGAAGIVPFRSASSFVSDSDCHSLAQMAIFSHKYYQLRGTPTELVDFNSRSLEEPQPVVTFEIPVGATINESIATDSDALAALDAALINEMVAAARTIQPVGVTPDGDEQAA